MEILRLLSSRIKTPENEFLVVGGLAVSGHGFHRATGDLDLAIRASSRDFWCALLSELKYVSYFESTGFVQFRPPELGTWPIDLLLLDSSTFDRMWAESLAVRIAGSDARIPSLRHLIAMKLFALRGRGIENRGSDDRDVVELARIGGIDLSSEEFRQMCEVHGNLELYEQLRKKDSR